MTEPPRYQSGPRCEHGVPMTVACSLCTLDADPLRAPGTDELSNSPDTNGRSGKGYLTLGWLPLALLLAALLLAWAARR